MKDNYFNEIKIGDGLIINGDRLKHLKDLEIKSVLDNLSEVTVTFYGKIDGLDNIKEEFSFSATGEINTKSIKKGKLN